ncbi:MAG: hypothetical protein AAFX81_12815 [Pseudomonadota bacterium]
MTPEALRHRAAVGALPTILFIVGCATTQSGAADTSELDEIASRPDFVSFAEVLRENQDASTECADYEPASRTRTLATTYVLAGSSGTSPTEMQFGEEPPLRGIGAIPFGVVDGLVCATFGDADFEVTTDDVDDLGADVLDSVIGELMVTFASAETSIRRWVPSGRRTVA